MTFNLVHATDIHLNFCKEDRIRIFCDQILEKEPDALVITGDISEAPTVVDHLAIISLLLDKSFPIFFVLGNHDYYNGSITEVRETIKRLFTYTEEMKIDKAPRLAWLGSSGIIPLTDNVALVGADGWYDGQYANWFTSKVMLNDYLVIRELNDRSCPVHQLKFEKINELSKNSAEYVRANTEKAFKDFNHIFVATHVAPFRESAVYQGKISNDDWMPHFSSKAMGDVLYKLAEANPDKKITVLCGHSHGEADVTLLPNLRAVTGGAKYYLPSPGKVFSLL